jgi:S-adenosylmethionine synthetase
MNRLVSAESVTEGHPDKVADQVSDAILDAAISQDPMSRVAIETLATTGVIHVAGEMTTKADLNIQGIVRDVLRRIDYSNDPSFSSESCGIFVSIDEQSPEISQGVSQSLEAREGNDKDQYDLLGAGDQGIMFGYATRETKELMPLPIALAHALSKRLALVRKELGIKTLLPDGKTQVTIEYDGLVPVGVETILISTQHTSFADLSDVTEVLKDMVIHPVLVEFQLSEPKTILINPSGRFILGGPQADTGLTGRKIISDTYGGSAKHGGGAFSGKDPTKVDRSAAYALRWVAKNVVAADLAEKIEIQVAYAIGKAHPVGLYIDTFGTNTLPESKILKAIQATFDLRPAAIIDQLDLQKPIYSRTSVYGHFGKPELAWEQINKAQELRKNI